MQGKRPRDAIYARPLDEPAAFTFDERVAAVFPDMINRSVPGYATVIAMLTPLAGRYVQPGSRCYDLGCSLGAATLALRHGIRAAGVRIIGVDNSAAMLGRCREHLDLDGTDVPVELVCADLRDVAIEEASLVALVFTLQFIPPGERDALIRRVYAGLRPGGVLVLAEKICFGDPARQARVTELHHEFKRANGYSELEISQKRTALENVLIPETAEAHTARLGRAGFRGVEQWFHCLNFAAWLAVK